MDIFNGKLRALDLFSGIGGNTLGLGEYIKTIAYCEADKHAQSVLLSRMGDGSIEAAPIWDDVTTLTGNHFDVPIDIIVGGFPCQDISVAGKGEGIVEGNRSGLFYEVIRLAKEIKPTFLFLENVPAIRTRGLDAVIQELTEIGYDIRWTMLSASDVGANHKRERWFLLGYSQHIGHTSTTFARSYGENNREKSQGEIQSSEFAGTSKHSFVCQNLSESQTAIMANPNNSGSRPPKRSSNGNGEKTEQEWENESFHRSGRCGENVAHAQRKGLESNWNCGSVDERISPQRFAMSSIYSSISNVADPRGERFTTRECCDMGEAQREEKGSGDKPTPTTQCLCSEISDLRLGGLECKRIGNRINEQSGDKSCHKGEIANQTTNIAIESRLGGMVDGISNNVDQGEQHYLNSSYWEKEPQGIPRITEEKEQRTERIKRLGNAVVPLQAKIAFEILLGIK